MFTIIGLKAKVGTRDNGKKVGYDFEYSLFGKVLNLPSSDADSAASPKNVPCPATFREENVVTGTVLVNVYGVEGMTESAWLGDNTVYAKVSYDLANVFGTTPKDVGRETPGGRNVYWDTDFKYEVSPTAVPKTIAVDVFVTSVVSDTWLGALELPLQDIIKSCSESKCTRQVKLAKGGTLIVKMLYTANNRFLDSAELDRLTFTKDQSVRTFFEADIPVWTAPPLTVGAKVFGGLGYRVLGGAIFDCATLKKKGDIELIGGVSASGKVGVALRATIDGVIVAAGVEGSLTVFDGDAPAFVSVNSDESCGNVEMDMKAMSGQIDVYGRLGVSILSVESRKLLLSWEGKKNPVNLIHKCSAVALGDFIKPASPVPCKKTGSLGIGPSSLGIGPSRVFLDMGDADNGELVWSNRERCVVCENFNMVEARRQYERQQQVCKIFSCAFSCCATSPRSFLVRLQRNKRQRQCSITACRNRHRKRNGCTKRCSTKPHMLFNSPNKHQRFNSPNKRQRFNSTNKRQRFNLSKPSSSSSHPSHRFQQRNPSCNTHRLSLFWPRQFLFSVDPKSDRCLRRSRNLHRHLLL